MVKTEKVTLTLPNNLMQEVRELAPARGQSKFIAEAIEAFLDEKRRESLRAELVAGYQATFDEMRELNAEWEPTDIADWDKHVPSYESEESTRGTDN